MKIAFLGDSITKGTHGVSYVKMIQDEFCNDEILNYGVGGDTVISLNKRLKTITGLDQQNLIFIFIGVNDILSQLSPLYKIIKMMMKQKWTKTPKRFSEEYTKTIKYLTQLNQNIVIIPLLLIGETITSKWNKKIDELVIEIKKISQELNIIYLDIREKMINNLNNNKISNYIPYSAKDMKNDGNCKSIEEFDLLSKNRGLQLTIDGVHINSLGARIIAKEVIEFITDFKEKEGR